MTSRMMAVGRWLGRCALVLVAATAPAAAETETAAATAPAAAETETAAATAPAAAETETAAAAPLVDRPAGWSADREQAAALSQRFAASARLGGLPVSTAAEAYVGKTPGVVLLATRATATLSDDVLPARIVRVALDELRASPQRAVLTGGSPRETAWQERVEPGPRVVAATLSWTDAASHTAQTARLVIASDGRHMAAVTGECIASDAADRAAIAACQKSLATLDPGIPVATRVALVPPPADAAAMTDAAATPSLPPRAPRLDDGGRISYPPTVIPQQPRAADRRSVYLGVGLVALALVFWWNRRRRDRFDLEDRGTTGTPGHDEGHDRGDEPRRDDDADDLHAAARGAPDGPPPGEPRPAGPPSTPGTPDGKEDQS